MTLSSGVLDATFLPELGMLGSSLRHRGDELLALPGGLDGYRAGNVTGLPLLAPWANRLGARRYEVEGVVVDLEGLDLHTDGHGLPIHGTMSARPGWEVIAVDGRSLASRFDFGAHPELLASFPFPHEIRIDVAVDATTLTVATTLTPTTGLAVPVAFGYHPYLSPSRCETRRHPPPPAGPSAPRARRAPTSDRSRERRGRRGRGARDTRVRRPLRAR